MVMQVLTDFFMWCSIINSSLLLFWFAFFALTPNFLYRLQGQWFNGSKEAFNNVMYSFLALFKIFVIVFNITPYVALLIIS
ncbi:MAG: hypothetical protein KAG34_10745 [Cocleimonas sp.]|nr:hypothetical protein [Cocleimonas sp.]